MSMLVNEASIPTLLQEMSVEEKIDLLTGWSAFSSLEMTKYGIPSVRYLDGATGANMLQYIMEISSMMALEQKDVSIAESSASSNESGASMLTKIKYAVGNEPFPDTFTESVKAELGKLREIVRGLRPEGEEPGCFPPGMLLGATWNPDVVYRVGEAVAREAEAFNIDVLLGTPNTNIQRDPKNGRVFESFSEDPYLSSRLAPAMVRGVQDQGVVADVKHYAANNQETLRQGIDEHISERALREIYFPGFEAAVKEGKVESVMSAYNSINGVPCAHNKWLLTDVLKNEWGFEGQVVSDWGAVYDQVEALNAGNDLDMPGPRGRKKLYEAAQNGTLAMERIDDAVARALRLILKTPKFNGKKHTRIDNALSEQAAYTAAVEGITLLKNDGILPLKQNTPIALFGELSERFMESGSGSAQVDTSKYTSLLAEAKRYTDRVAYGEINEETQTVIITAGASGQEGRDRPDMDFDIADKAMLAQNIAQAKNAGKKIIVLLNVAGPVELSAFIDDIDALVLLYFPGMQGARAAADILFGDVSPSGKLPLSFPKTYRDTPTAINFPGEFGRVNYGEGIFVGYRYYDYKCIEPLYPFGYGLGYSSFAITNARLSAKEYTYTSGKPLKISVDVRNEGGIQAKEVVQLYVRHPDSTLQKPDKELKGFAKVNLMPGETKTVTLELCEHSFASYDTSLGRWTVEPGVYEILLGNSSRNISITLPVMVKGPNPYGSSVRSTLAVVSTHEGMLKVLQEELGDSFDQGKLKSNAEYFGETSLKTYLGMILPDHLKSAEELGALLEKLDARFLQL